MTRRLAKSLALAGLLGLTTPVSAQAQGLFAGDHALYSITSLQMCLPVDMPDDFLPMAFGTLGWKVNEAEFNPIFREYLILTDEKLDDDLRPTLLAAPGDEIERPADTRAMFYSNEVTPLALIYRKGGSAASGWIECTITGKTPPELTRALKGFTWRTQKAATGPVAYAAQSVDYEDWAAFQLRGIRETGREDYEFSMSMVLFDTATVSEMTKGSGKVDFALTLFAQWGK